MSETHAMVWTGADGQSCPVAKTLHLLGGKWKPMILHLLSGRGYFFLEIVRALPSASRKVIATSLRELEADGVITRTPQNDARGRVRYALSARGARLVMILAQIAEWAQEPDIA